jgi:hypothetical protein
MVDLVRPYRSIVNIGREDKALQRCTLSARSMPGDGQEHRLRLVLLPSHPSSGRKATNLLNWGAAPSQAKQMNYLRAVGHMSRLVVLLPRGKAAFLGLTRVSEREDLNEVDVHSDILETWIFAVF